MISNMAKWPPYTCVAAFVYHSLEMMDIETDPAAVARELHIRVSAQSYNPFGLQTEEFPLSWGLSAKDARIYISRFLHNISPGLSFRHVRLSQIPYQMFEETITSLLDNKCVVGIGYDFADVDRSVRPNRHVSFIIQRKQSLITKDYYDNTGGTELSFSLAQLIRSSSKIDDGLWIIGPGQNIDTTLT